jgi:hypothetical protein
MDFLFLLWLFPLLDASHLTLGHGALLQIGAAFLAAANSNHAFAIAPSRHRRFDIFSAGLTFDPRGGSVHCINFKPGCKRDRFSGEGPISS